ncbi:hypothetical protein BCU22_022625 (plasmid) [Vibrio cyclitrophicus]|uniref:F4 family fimbrial subunit n=1 Tax=Vibrio cyclitrophicus TaxID=47951 RepID=UPI000C85F090|nr:hypothetical protein [Vibrio cyclitrophicus]PMJ44435.1 hypothetical protein BCU22_06855 [Vibrio cyclitrophicus]
MFNNKVNILKKSTIAIALMAATAGSAYAFTDATGGAWSGSLDFDGTISNTNPLWEFEVPPETVILTTDMTQYVSEGVVNGENTEFALTTLDDAVLFHGNIKAVLPQGIPGMVPDIMFSGVEVSVDAVEGSSEVSITLPANDGDADTGTITFSIGSGAAVMTGTASSNIGVWYNGDDNPVAGAAAHALLMQIPGLGDIYPGGEPVYTTSPYENIDGWIDNEDYNNQFHARAFVSKSAVVSFPSANIPTTWSASLPITVTVQ